VLEEVAIAAKQRDERAVRALGLRLVAVAGFHANLVSRRHRTSPEAALVRSGDGTTVKSATQSRSYVYGVVRTR
jgi:hypothetical protein